MLFRSQKYVKYHDYNAEPSAKAVRRAINKIGAEYFPQILELRRADTLAQSAYQQAEKLERIDAIARLYDEIMEQQQCVSLKTLEITGNDLIALGVPKGKRIGAILAELLDDVLQNPENNTHDYLMEEAKKLI